MIHIFSRTTQRTSPDTDLERDMMNFVIQRLTIIVQLCRPKLERDGNVDVLTSPRMVADKLLQLLKALQLYDKMLKQTVR